MLEHLFPNIKEKVTNQHWSVNTLRIIITLWTVGILVLVWFVVDNPVALIAILLYEVLP